MAKRLQPIKCPVCETVFQPRSYKTVYCSRTCLGKGNMRSRPKRGFYKDITGKVFGRLTVQGYSHTVGKRSYWLCLCECGNTKPINKADLTSKSTISCGCRQKEIQDCIKQYSPNSAVTHGCARTRLGKRTQAYKVWCWMKRRCMCSNAKDYKYYGALGVKVCERWMRFENFLADMGDTPEGLTIDRYPDNCGDYEPGNCRWATWEQQYENRRPRSSYIDKAENGDVLKIILLLRKDGKNLREIAYELTEKGIPSPRGGVWWNGTIGKIIREYEKVWI